MTITKKDIHNVKDILEESVIIYPKIGSICTSKKDYVELSVLLETIQQLKEKINIYRKSNELWRKSQDENLSDFENWIDKSFQLESQEEKKSQSQDIQTTTTSGVGDKPDNSINKKVK